MKIKLAAIKKAVRVLTEKEAVSRAGALKNVMSVFEGCVSKTPNITGNMKQLTASGRYKMTPETKVIDKLMELKTSGGKQRFVRKELENVLNESFTGSFVNARNFQYSDKHCLEIVNFAKRDDVVLQDIAEFARMPEGASVILNDLSKERFKVFKEFLPYTRGKCLDDSIKNISEVVEKQRFSVNDLQRITRGMPEESVDIIRKLVDIKAPNGGGYLFSGQNLMDVVSVKNLDTDVLVNLAKESRLNGTSIINISKVTDINLNKLSKHMKRIQKSNKDTVFAIEKDKYNRKHFQLQYLKKSNDNEVLTEIYDNNINLVSSFKTYPVKGNPNQIRIVGKNYDVVEEMELIKLNDFDKEGTRLIKTISETRQVKDAAGKLVRTEYLTPSAVDGLHNWRAVYPDGSVKPLVEIKKSKNGVLSITKEMDGLDGTITKSRYKKLPDGSWAMRVDITKNGTDLAQRRIKHRMISDKEAVSVVNGEKFKVLYSPDRIKVINSKGEDDCIVNLKNLIDDNNSPENALKFKKMLKECSVDELRIISKRLNKLEYVENSFKSNANIFTGKICTNNNIFSFRHELGHIDDFSVEAGTSLYSSTEGFKKVYSQELNNFVKEFDVVQKRYLNYFINDSEPMLTNMRLGETAAELFAVNRTSNFFGKLGIRTEYLERYFPKTRSFLLNA